VISSVERDGRPVFRDLRWGVYVVFRAGSDAGREYVRRCFKEYGLVTDKTGEYTAMYKPYHLIGLELGISLASAGLRNEPTGAPLAWWQDGALDWRADVVATAKRALSAGEALDGEGGFTVYGKIAPANESVAEGALPLGLAHGCTLKRNIAAHETVRWEDVQFAAQNDVQQRAIAFRREMEALARNG
jgi:predicted homoserine dehydrogenase-like protein